MPGRLRLSVELLSDCLWQSCVHRKAKPSRATTTMQSPRRPCLLVSLRGTSTSLAAADQALPPLLCFQVHRAWV